MKRWNFVVLGLVLLLGPVAMAQAPAGGAGPTAAEAERSAQALAVYEEGKRLYDARDYAGALARFDQAAELEPDKARWQYNRGLALRKLKRDSESRAALLRSRALDPEYKRAEIDDKLREMGFSSEDPASSGSSTGSPIPGAVPEASPPASDETAATLIGVVFCLGMVALVSGVIFFMIRFITRKARGASSEEHGERHGSRRASRQPVAGADVSPLERRLERVASTLSSVEHAMRLEEDADLRAMLNQSTMTEQRARDEVAKARSGRVGLQAAEVQVDAAEESTQVTERRARELFGDKAFLPEGERVGCYFCARPLANASFRMQVPLKRGSEVTPVLACPPCANMAAAGQPPPIKVRMERGERMVHWSELDGYDPYTHHHKPYPLIRTVPAWDFAPHERSLGEVAAIAAGTAVVGGLAAYGVSRMLDLDSAQEAAQEAAAAQAAAEAAARKASEHREERDWKDHS